MYNCTPVLQSCRPTTTAATSSKHPAKGVAFVSKFFSPVFILLALLLSSRSEAQLGVFPFTGTGACPHQNPSVTSQPANALFSSFTTVNTNCTVATDIFQSSGWNNSPAIDLTEYNQFSITPNAGYALTLASLSFTQYTDEDAAGSGWVLRSSIDNYTTDLATGTAGTTVQTPSVTLPAASFANTGSVTFRLYFVNAKTPNTNWTLDDVTLSGTVVTLPADPANPTSDSPQCASPGVTLTAAGSAPGGVTWYWQTSASGTSTANAGATYNVTSSGTYYIRAQDNATLAWSAGAGSVTVSITPNVSIPVFSLGAGSSRCQGAGTVTYTATASNSTGITYSLDPASITGGNTINAGTGQVSFDAAWTGTTVITASAAGCNGPVTATHTVTINSNVGTPVFTLGASSTRCSGASTITYTATAPNSTAITYSLDALSLVGGNTINATTGAVTYSALWVGSTTITASAAGCNGPQTATHTVTISGAVGIPSFAMGASSSRCQGAGTITYTATASNNTGITYSLDAASITGGNTINSTTGEVTYAAGWAGTTVITASATGCGGPRTANHTVTTVTTIGTPVFTLGATTTRCQGAGIVTYTATATGATGMSYALDAASITGGNSINTATGAVTYVAGWSGTTIITATATGCNGPTQSTHSVTVTPTVAIPSFTLGATSIRCQGAGPVTYTATAANASAITYSLNAAAVTGGNTINTSTGVVTYAAGWTGSTIITASAAGCGGPRTATHTVTITPTVGTPVFTLGAASTRCQGAGTVTYTATATNNTGITYSLDAGSITGGNTINTATGAVTYAAGWSGTTVITATAAGCNGPSTASHAVTINGTVASPVFTLGATSTRCQGAGPVTYTATAANATGITYSLDAASVTGGNSINSSTGVVAYVAGWSGTSIVTASAAGCGGPQTSTHTITITPTVGLPVFALGASSTRCQGAGSVTYTATATNNTSISYSLDAASITGGNSINTTTGAVSYVAGWTGSSIITATANGCNGPRTSSHTVTITPTVGTPVFAAGPVSVRTQAAVTVTYNASATNTTGITYSLDGASVTGGNTINASTGAVNWAAGWNGTTVITASAAGCSGPSTATHTVTINAAVVTKHLYLSGPGQTLDRVDPVATGLTTTDQTSTLSSGGGSSSTTFTQNPVLCSDLVIKAQPVTVSTYISVTSGSMPANPNITAVLRYGATTILTLTNPSYNSGTGLLTWTATPATDITVPGNQAIALQVTTAQGGVSFRIDYHSQSKPSKISLPVSSYININSFDLYNAAYPGGSIRINGTGNTQLYGRAVVTDPFGYSDITGADITITPPGSTTAAVSVATAGCERTYEYPWTTPLTGGNYILTARAKEGFENTVTHARSTTFNVCSSCPPVAVDDAMSGAGGAPLTVDVLANDYDPNNNIRVNTLSVLVQPTNGSGYYSDGKIVYLPNGSFAGNDTLTYQICDSTGLCASGKIYFTISPFLVDPCAEATMSHTYYLPFSEDEARMALDSSTNTALASNNIRTVISMKMPYPGMTIVWDHWEDGYELNPLNPLQTTTKVWGDGNPYNGIAPGYGNDIIPAGGSIVLDNTIPTNPRVAANIFFDGRDKIFSSGQITITQVCGEPSIMAVQCMKTNVSSTLEYGTSFTIPVGEDFNSKDFDYTSLFIRASANNTVVNVDKDNNGTFETTATINEGEVMLVNGGVLSGATVTGSQPIGIDLHFGGNDSYSSRDVPIFPATWYYHTYFTPVPTTGASTAIKDTAVVMLYNSLNRPLTINWSSGIPSSGNITLPAKSVVRFPLALSATAAYKFVNPTGESFTAIQICDSYTPGGGGNTGLQYDWSFNLIAQNRLTDFATVAWAPGSIDGTRNDNPIWVTPTANTTIYVKYDGDVGGSSGLLSPCGMRYDVSYTLNALNHRRLRDPNDNDQSGMAVFTCDGTKLAAVYGEDASTAVQANPSWDVGSTIQPFCKQKLIFANDDYHRTIVNQPVTIAQLNNDFGFLAVIDPATVNTTGLLQPSHGTVSINPNGTILYTPNPGYVGKDTFQYQVCSTPSPVVCDIATVYIDISVCPAPFYENVIAGQVFLDKNDDGLNNDGKIGVAGPKVYLYVDGNCNNTIDNNELKDSITVDASGTYQFITYPEKMVADDFDNASGGSTCASGNDGNASWLANWTDLGDPSTGFCNSSQSAANTDAEIVKDGSFSNALRLKGSNVSATRTVNTQGASYAFLTFSYRRKSATLSAGEDVIVQASSNGTTFGTVFTISGNGTADAGYTTVYNQDVTAWAGPTTYIRFLTNNNVDDADTVYIDDVKLQYLTYPQCYITRLDPATVPAYHHTTTALQHSFTATSDATCLAPYDFGIAKNKITLTGTLFNDANGLTDNLVNGTPIGMVSGATVYAYLVDTSGKVAARSVVNTGNGTYSFNGVDVFADYTVRLSTQSVNVGDVPPSAATFDGIWVMTGDAFGSNNTAGSGVQTGTPDASILVRTANSNVTNVNFGIERLPESDNHYTTIPKPSANQFITLNGGTNPPVLSGADPEDYPGGGVLSTRDLVIDTVPSNAELYYNGTLVTNGLLISGFDPSLLQVKFLMSTLGYSTLTFRYSHVDEAGMKDPTPATYTLVWNMTLSATGLTASASLNGQLASVKWYTLTEENTDFFIVERSVDNNIFTPTGSPVDAAGSSASRLDYQLPDNVSSLSQYPVIYYRVKLVDIDAKFKYSNVVAVRISQKPGVTIWPNPFLSYVTVSITTETESVVDISLVDISGKTVRKTSQQVPSGISRITVGELDRLPAGMYLIEIADRKAGTTYQKLIKNND